MPAASAQARCKASSALKPACSKASARDLSESLSALLDSAIRRHFSTHCRRKVNGLRPFSKFEAFGGAHLQAGGNPLDGQGRFLSHPCCHRLFA